MKETVPLKLLNSTIPKAAIPRPRESLKPWLTDKPRHAPTEAQPFLYAIAFLQTVLDHDTDARQVFLELVCDLDKPGCQELIEVAESEHFDARAYMVKALAGAQPEDLLSQSTTVREYRRQLDEGTFSNWDFLEFLFKVGEFIEAYCNSRADYEDDRCKLTLITAPSLYGAVVIRSLFHYLNKDPENIDRERIGPDVQSILNGNPTSNKAKLAKSRIVAQWKMLQWLLHNDSQYLRRTEIFYRATVNPGKLVDLASETSRREHGNPANVKRRLGKDIAIVRAALKPK